VLESVRDIDSDHYKAQVINNLLSKKLPAQQIQNLVGISSSIDSDHYVTEVLNTLLSKQGAYRREFKDRYRSCFKYGERSLCSQVLISVLKSNSTELCKAYQRNAGGK